MYALDFLGKMKEEKINAYPFRLYGSILSYSEKVGKERLFS